ncbi:MAG: class I SAM-dependent methyltransferase [Spirochaetota bacterium]
MPGPSAKDLEQAGFLRNRVAKNEKRLRKWARNAGISAFRVYDRDIPEIPLAIDLFRSTGEMDGRGSTVPGEEHDCLLVALYERPYEKEVELEAQWLALMAQTVADCLGVNRELTFTRQRRHQRGLAQYERLGSGRAERIAAEGGHRFIVNLSDYLDTGLFLDHRPTRSLVEAATGGLRVLNLFCYTGSFSVYAAAGGAREVTSVDLSNTYLAWARRNLDLNGFKGPAFPLVRSDVRAFLSRAKDSGRTWDFVIADPPTFSNSSATERDFDVNRDWPELLASCQGVLSEGGTVLFSSNSRKLKWDSSLVEGRIEDLSESCLGPDFRDRRIRRTWRVTTTSHNFLSNG